MQRINLASSGTHTLVTQPIECSDNCRKEQAEITRIRLPCKNNKSKARPHLQRTIIDLNEEMVVILMPSLFSSICSLQGTDGPQKMAQLLI